MVYVYLVLLYIRPQDWIPWISGIPIYSIVVVALAVSAFVKYNRQESRENIKAIQTYFLLGFLVCAVVSNILGSYTDALLEQLNMNIKRFVVFSLVLLNLGSKEDIRNTLTFMALLTALLAVHSIIQAKKGVGFAGVGLTPGYTEVRVRWLGDWDGPNVFAVLFIVSIPLAMEWIFGRTRGIVTRVSGAALFALFVAGIYLTDSRGAFIALGCVLVTYLLSRFGGKWGLIFAVLCLVVIAARPPSRVTNISSGESSAHERVYTWERGLALLREKPVFGVGRGQFARAAGTGLIAHNNFVQVFTETGLAGFFCWMGAVWWSFRSLYSLWRRSDRRAGAATESLTRILLVILVAFFSATFFVVVENELLYVLFALWSACGVLCAKELPDPRPIRFGKWDLAATLVGMVGVIAAVWVAAVLRIV